MKDDLIQFAMSVFVIVIGIILTGMILDEAGRGTFGGFFQGLAKKTTNGFGDANA